MGEDKNRNNTMTKARKTIFKKPVFQTDFSARSGCPAPRFCPTKVADALAMPQEGRMVNTITLRAIVYPAIAALPNSDTIRAKKIQLADPIRNCPVLPADTLSTCTITFQSILKLLVFSLTMLFPKNKKYN